MSKNIDTIQRFQKFMAQGDTVSAFTMITDDATWHSDEIGAPWSGIHQGITEIKTHFNNIAGTTNNFKRHTDQFIEDGNLVIELGGLECILKKTNQPFKTEYVCLYRVNDNKISYYRIFEDSLKLYKAYFSQKAKGKSLKFENSITQIQPNELAKIITAEEISKHFPAPAPGAVSIFKDTNIAVGMVCTDQHASYPHKNDHDEVHYVITGQGKFRHGNDTPSTVKAGDVVYVKSPEQHEWFDCSDDFKLIFIQCGPQGE